MASNSGKSYEFNKFLNTGTLRKEVLQKVAKSCGVSPSGTKSDITRRINHTSRQKKKERDEINLSKKKKISKE